MTRTRSSSPLWAAAPLAMLVFAGWQTAATLSRTPALNGSLLVETADGDRFPRFLPSMHNYPEYLYQVAYDWRNRPGTGAAFGRDGDGASGSGMFSRLRRLRDLLAEISRTQGVSPEAQANARSARVLVTESLRLQPGNPAAWILLAQVDDALGDGEAALAAYLTSQELAPHTTTFAVMRLGFLKSVLEDPGGQDLARSMIDPQIVQTDRRAAGLLGYARLAENPAIRQFVGEQAEAN